MRFIIIILFMFFNIYLNAAVTIDKDGIIIERLVKGVKECRVAKYTEAVAEFEAAFGKDMTLQQAVTCLILFLQDELIWSRFRTCQEKWKLRWDKDIRSLDAVIKKAESMIREVTFEKTSAEASLQVLQSKLDNLQTKEKKIDKLVKKLDEKAALLALVRDAHPDVWETITSEVRVKDDSSFVKGLVAAVRTAPNGQQDLIMITVDSDDKVKSGMEFIIYREDKYIVKARVKKVMPDMVACWVIPETWNANGYKVEEDDIAQNTLFLKQDGKKGIKDD